MIPPNKNKCKDTHIPGAVCLPCTGASFAGFLGAVSWCHRVTAEVAGQERRAAAGQARPLIPAFAFDQDLLEEWKGKGAQVEEIGRRGTLLENLIVEITAPDTPSKAGELQPAFPTMAPSLALCLLSPLHLL